MHNLSLIDETFDLNFTPEYILSILVNQDGFSFSILDTIQNKIVYLSHHDIYTNEIEFQHKKIKAIYEETDLLQRSFKKTNIYISSFENFTLIPSEYSNTEFLETAYSLNFNTDYQVKTYKSHIPEADTYAVYGINKMIIDLIEKKHPGIEIQNDITICTRKYQSDKNTLIIRIFRKYINILLLDSQLSFCNSFKYEGENDMLYYALGACKTTGIEPSKVILEGIVNKHSEIYHRLRQYFEHVSIAENNNDIKYSYLLDKLPDSRFVTLFNSFS